MQFNRLMIVPLAFLLLAQLVWAQEPDAIAYETAYGNILNENWKTDEREMAEILKKYPKSYLVDDACFWQCYAQSKMSNSLEKSVMCYENFIKTYPKSRWVNDAEMNLVSAAKILAGQGKRDYEAFIRKYEHDSDMELKLSALHALMNMDDEKATTVILDLYDSTDDPRLKEKMLFTFAEYIQDNLF